MIDLDNQVLEALKAVKGAYPDFITGCAEDVEDNTEAQEELLKYLRENPNVGTGAVIKKIINDIVPEMLDEQDEDE